MPTKVPNVDLTGCQTDSKRTHARSTSRTHTQWKSKLAYVPTAACTDDTPLQYLISPCHSFDIRIPAHNCHCIASHLSTAVNYGRSMLSLLATPIRDSSGGRISLRLKQELTRSQQKGILLGCIHRAEYFREVSWSALRSEPQTGLLTPNPVTRILPCIRPPILGDQPAYSHS